MADARVTAMIVASALFMQNLDSAAVVTALPSMARDMGEEPTRLGVAITSYLVALTVFIPVSGYIADRFGAKRVFLVAIALFGAASMACGLSNSLIELVIARVVQGMAGAMMVPVGRLLLLSGIRKDEMLTAMTWLTMPAMIGPISGPPLGGVLTDLFGWRSVFWINLPVAVIGLVMVAWKIEPLPRTDPGPPDVKGLALVGGALAALMAGIETVGRGIFPTGWPEGLIALGAVLGVWAVRHCRAAPKPALDLGLLKIPSFRYSTMAGSLFRSGAGGIPFLVPMLLQVGFGWSATEAGFVAFATAIGAFLMKPLTRPILRRFGFRTVILGNGVLAALGVASGAMFTADWPIPAMFLVLALGGLFRSMQFTALNTLAFADTSRAQLSAATSFYGTAQQLAPALGVVLATASLELARHVNGDAVLRPADFTAAFLVAALVVAASIPFALGLPRDVGSEVSGRKLPPGPPPSGSAATAEAANIAARPEALASEIVEASPKRP
ncbi:MFS transporter [Roseococcus sp. SYP-B2431]|uniref:MDR family MFS transporter n=1 Tax=Roseococcus sp. SYP-B2431 TaxID=2496640 RepID=UPI001038F502|nr:MDR family MFS transporter [Roseococcus sp. SYP-B2431]TCH97682.1 MFS transporter [Roseococcus sp. SYP-B2431]